MMINDEIKYSIIMPYYDKARELKITLDSFVYRYGFDNDLEIIIVEDSKNYKNKKLHEELTSLIKDYRTLPCNNTEYEIKHIICCKDTGYNPAELFNLGVSKSSGDYIVLTNPECAHEQNILEGLAQEFSKNSDAYVVCGCRNVEVTDTNYISIENIQFKNLKWYQHSKYRNACYHFCSAISKENYNKIGGFDENFSKGIGYDDDDFRDSVLDAGLDFVLKDDLLTLHINHKNSFELENYNELVGINHKYYLQKKCSKPGVRIGIALPCTDEKVHTEFMDSWNLMTKPAKFTYLRPKSPARIDIIRNQLVEQALEAGCTDLIFLDTDQDYAQDTLVKLMSHDLDVVGTMVCKRYDPFNPILLRGTLGKYRSVSDEEMESNDLIEVSATGTGCIRFRTKVFFDIDSPWFEFSQTEEGRPIGEDIYMCSKLIDKDYKIWVDTTINIKHLSMMKIDYNFYKINKHLNQMRRKNER